MHFSKRYLTKSPGFIQLSHRPVNGSRVKQGTTTVPWRGANPTDAALLNLALVPFSLLHPPPVGTYFTSPRPFPHTPLTPPNMPLHSSIIQVLRRPGSLMYLLFFGLSSHQPCHIDCKIMVMLCTLILLAIKFQNRLYFK